MSTWNCFLDKGAGSWWEWTFRLVKMCSSLTKSPCFTNSISASSQSYKYMRMNDWKMWTLQIHESYIFFLLSKLILFLILLTFVKGKGGSSFHFLIRNLLLSSLCAYWNMKRRLFKQQVWFKFNIYFCFYYLYYQKQFIKTNLVSIGLKVLTIIFSDLKLFDNTLR